jgi:hypothetical protein
MFSPLFFRSVRAVIRPNAESQILCRPQHGLQPVMHIDFSEDIPGMGFDGVQTDAEFICDFLIS